MKPVLPPLQVSGPLASVLPAEDRTLSPYSGLTRDHWIAVADHLLASADAYRSPAGARINFPGRPSQQGTATDGLEGFARTFLLAAFLHAGGADRNGHLQKYVDGLIAGTRTIGADDNESWPVVGHIGRDGQPHVEAAGIALGLHLTKDDTWGRLKPDEQDRLADWFRATIEQEPSPNNWYLFPATIASFLEGVGRADDQTRYVIDRALGLIEVWYRGQGWYSDGAGDAFDHYIGWALHLYPVLHARLRGIRELEQRYGDRLEEFLQSFARTFDRNGAPLYYGRSMTYRTATLAAVALGEAVGRTPLSPGQTRRILSGGLRYFVERGSITDNGVLSLGWHREHLPTIQRYSGPGSPYWASKGFLALMLPADHPVWTSEETALATDTEDQVQALDIGLLIQNTAADGLVRVHNHGSDHLKPDAADAGAPDPLYARFGYSTRTGPTSLHDPADNDIQVRIRRVWSARRKIHTVASGPNWIASWHAPRFPRLSPWEASDTADGGPVLPSARIESLTAARGAQEVRIHRLIWIPPSLPLRISGWAVAGSRPSDFEVAADGLAVDVEAGGLRSGLVGLHGWTSAGTSSASYGTAYGEWAVVPELLSTTSPTDTIYVAGATLSGVPVENVATAAVDGAVVTIDWGDERQAFDLGAIFAGIR
ncbi:DUF2264 domain-containing protein [Kribbella jiaozuonensis]|uniref:DUF2264 domain-containing protein n=1 Tax=Kribbella jiaozuonensis TaxID=2575441 RepID=A0A4V6XB98_9ACTN|nr:DUF2264 domain-containing protein [Kribbella jiaozuonensis]TKK82753.1 DUF2264 domain-containing protein [Kribbella jiaozuonensis]